MIKLKLIFIIILCFAFFPLQANGDLWKIWGGDSWNTVPINRWTGADWISVPYREFDFWVGIGQSNGQGVGDSSLSPDVTDGMEIRWNGTMDTTGISDPVGFGDIEEVTFGVAVTGSLWPSFAQKYYDLTGKKVIIMSICRGASSMTSEGDTGYGYWAMDIYDLAKIEIDEAITQLNSGGYKYNFKGIICYLGENDASEAVAGATYKEDAKILVDQFFADYSIHPDLTFNMIEIGDDWFPNGTGIQVAQSEFCATESNVYLTTKEPDAHWPHLYQYQYNSLGERVATDIAGRQ